MTSQPHSLRNCALPIVNPGELDIIASLLELLPFGSKEFKQRFDIYDYIWRCNRAGFCNTQDAVRLCLERYLAGKRKVTPPGTAHKKKQARERRKILQNLPAELVTAIDKACDSPAAQQFKDGNTKALNSIVGMVLKVHRTDAALVKELVLQRLT